MPTFERLDQVARCIVSLMTQDINGMEVIVSDDSKSAAVADFCALMDPSGDTLRWAPGARTGNPVDNWNHGLDLATAPYVIMVHQDEFLLDPTYLRQAVEWLDANAREAVFARHAPIAFNRPSRFARAQRLAQLAGFPLWSLLAVNWIGPTAAVVFRSRADRRFDRDLVNLVDVDFYNRLIGEDGPPHFLDGLLVSGLGHHDAQITASINPRRLAYDELDLVFAKRPGLGAMQRAVLRRFAMLKLMLRPGRPLRDIS